MLLKITPLLALSLILLGNRSCESEQPARSQPAPVTAENSSDTRPQPKHLEIEADLLLPFVEGDQLARRYALLRDAEAALSRDDAEAAIAATETLISNAGTTAELAAEQRSRALSMLGQHRQAAKTLGLIPPASWLWPKTRLQLARAQFAEQGVAEALRTLDDLDARIALEASLGQSLQDESQLLRSAILLTRNLGDDAAVALKLCRGLWLDAKQESEMAAQAEACMNDIHAIGVAKAKLSLAEKVRRAKVLGQAHANRQVIELLADQDKALSEQLAEATPEGCEGSYELGRAHHKQRDYKRSIPQLDRVIDSCKDPELVVRARYLKALGEGRAGRGQDSIESFKELARLHSSHSYADDALYLAGKQALKDDRPELARTLFTEMSRRFPEGDMVGPGLWGMALADLRQDRKLEALTWLEQLAAGSAKGKQREHVLKARYWRGRVLLTSAPEQGIQQLSELARDAPLHYYGALAWWQLKNADPEAAKPVASYLAGLAGQMRQKQGKPERFHVERRFVEEPRIEAAIQMARGGFAKGAAQLISTVLQEAEDPWELGTLMFASHLLELAGDPYRSHNLLRKAFGRAHPAASAEHRGLLSYAFPLAFHDEVHKACAEYDWAPLLFQGLVREESAFLPAVVSWAGAMGLSQLMWPTAKETARKMGIKNLQREQLSEPTLNLRIGSFYFNGLHRRWKGHLPLAIGSYNAGPGAVRRWVRDRGDLDLDLWVETIPFDQTRHYVKRVLSSFQTYHLLYGTGSATVPLRVGPVRLALEQQDPT